MVNSEGTSRALGAFREAGRDLESTYGEKQTEAGRTAAEAGLEGKPGLAQEG